MSNQTALYKFVEFLLILFPTRVPVHRNVLNKQRNRDKMHICLLEGTTTKDHDVAEKEI